MNGPQLHDVLRVMFNGTMQTLRSFERYDLAVAYAEMAAESLARGDADRAWRGKPTSGVQAIICEYDVWNVPEMARGLSGKHPVDELVPRGEEHLKEALALATARMGYTATGERV
jgi:hypothetical protein